MKKFLFILMTLLIVGCENHNKTEKFYTAKSNFGGLYQKIEITTLDSILKNKSIYHLNKFRTPDSIKLFAYKILTQDLLKEKTDTSGLLIKWVRKLNDSIIEFRVCHLDDIVYEYYCNISNLPPPITGNISGYDGWYRININDKSLRIIITQ